MFWNSEMFVEEDIKQVFIINLQTTIYMQAFRLINRKYVYSKWE